ncbi:hypothetical protein ACOY4E_07970 [Pseudomonas aeruginosa]|uniref:hypothetical protein n=1 Tax=Pseudomonas aeruginosa TaxID=287 RepID=UPI0015880146|nr:hypothetical protein [Pseudomonas aeruginosa]MBH8871203.1 hypothetical protein [Pseudomonas aeruginosa]MBH9179422.1 hypothetical protein [Pseudomonas aeruginosa]MBW6288921.1 hypothetical protein [Pseudomonas aeruginosa]MBY9840403.1 hypothetical protein [Pseudomonas aeruginosa]MDN3852552.1 hypothetical protein [Pseudomonas aeruginosa]
MEKKFMRLFSVAWNNYRYSRVVPILLTTAVVGLVVTLLFTKGATMFMEGSLLSVVLSFLAFCFGISLLSTWWLKVKELYARPADNLWLSVIAAIVIFTGIYIDYGPNGEHVGETLALMPGYMLDQLVPGFTDELSRVVKDTRGH